MTDIESTGSDRSTVAASPANTPNGLRHSLALALTKTGDLVVDPKIVLAALLGMLGAPLWAVGLAAPIREAGSLAPQTLLSSRVESTPTAKGWWIAAAIGQAAFVAAMAMAAAFAPERLAPWLVLLFLAGFAVSRSLASLSYKRVLGASVDSGGRGTVPGRARSAAAALGVLFAASLVLGWVEPTPHLFAALLGGAAALWLLAGAAMAQVEETPRPVPDQNQEPGATKTSAWTRYWAQFAPLKTDAEFRRLLLVRGLLTVTALAPPYVAALSSVEADRIAQSAIGPLLIVVSAATALSAAPWGRLADRSSGRALLYAALLSATALAAAAAFAGLTPPDSPWRESLWPSAALLFVLTIAYSGVRAARSTHLVEIAPTDARAQYGAVANTVIGGVLMLTGLLGAAAQAIDPSASLLVFAGFALLAALAALGLEPRPGASDDRAAA